MDFLGFCDLTNYITTWCISWDFVISLTASPPDASPRFLWSRWLHHHLMHLLNFCDFTGCITTWCTFLYVGMSTLPNKCKGKEERGSEVYNIWIGSWPKGTTPMMLVGIFCVFIQFVNGHSTDDDEPPWLVIIFLFFFSSVANDDELPWFVVIYLFCFIKCSRWQWVGRLVIIS
jgi:hypothetical protein